MFHRAFLKVSVFNQSRSLVFARSLAKNKRTEFNAIHDGFFGLSRVMIARKKDMKREKRRSKEKESTERMKRKGEKKNNNTSYGGSFGLSRVMITIKWRKTYHEVVGYQRNIPQIDFKYKFINITKMTWQSYQCALSGLLYLYCSSCAQRPLHFTRHSRRVTPDVTVSNCL